MTAKRKLVFSIVPLAMTLMLCEAVLRATHLFGTYVAWTTPDANLAYRPIPGEHEDFFSEGDFVVKIGVNRYGWRGPEWSKPKPDGQIRVAVLGDSFVEALQVREDETVLSVAGHALRRSFGSEIELLNFGRSGFCQTEELFVLKTEVVQFSPDVVVSFFFAGNDIADATRRTAPSNLRPFYVASEQGGLLFDNGFQRSAAYRARLLIDPLKRQSALLTAVIRAYNTLSRDNAGSTIQNDVKDGYLSLCTDQPNPDFAESYAWAKRLLEEQALVARQLGVPFVLVTLDNPAHRPQVARELRQLEPSFDPSCFELDMGRWACAMDVYHLGLQSQFSKAYVRDGLDLHWPRDGHWNRAGHRVAGEALARTLSLVLEQEFAMASNEDAL